MLLDGETQFSNRQAITTTAVSTNIIDLGATGTRANNTSPLTRDIGGWDNDLLIQVTQDFAGGTSVQVQIQTDDNAAFASPTTVASSEVAPVASLKAGYRFGLADFPIRTEPRRVCRRLILVSYAAMGSVSRAA